MTTLVVVLHFLAALIIIGLVLIQQGKGAAMGASFGGGASATVFGSEGSGNFFTKSTWIIATLFFCTSFGLAVIAKHNSRVAIQGPAFEQIAPATPSAAIPVTTESAKSEEAAVPATADDLPVTAPSEGKVE
jgi:preprotein translocase subunit SecG